jgi:hypothetical protein
MTNNEHWLLMVECQANLDTLQSRLRELAHETGCPCRVCRALLAEAMHLQQVFDLLFREESD